MALLQFLSFKKKRQQNLLLSLFVDISAILLWRGTWGLLDVYVFPGKSELSFAVSAGLGLFLLLLLRNRVNR